MKNATLTPDKPWNEMHSGEKIALLAELLEQHATRLSWSGSSYNGSELAKRTINVLLILDKEAHDDHLFMQGGIGVASDGTDI